mmetsp:Transcript_32810/g.93107  ORF Transcript_32810/g.93107 Transcript_32810/m.93107 type:complete len:459 (+) Transcript_32810:342-1718(+)
MCSYSAAAWRPNKTVSTETRINISGAALATEGAAGSKINRKTRFLGLWTPRALRADRLANHNGVASEDVARLSRRALAVTVEEESGAGLSLQSELGGDIPAGAVGKLVARTGYGFDVLSHLICTKGGKLLALREENGARGQAGRLSHLCAITHALLETKGQVADTAARFRDRLLRGNGSWLRRLVLLRAILRLLSLQVHLDGGVLLAGRHLSHLLRVHLVLVLLCRGDRVLRLQLVLAIGTQWLTGAVEARLEDLLGSVGGARALAHQQVRADGVRHGELLAGHHAAPGGQGVASALHSYQLISPERKLRDATATLCEDGGACGEAGRFSYLRPGTDAVLESEGKVAEATAGGVGSTRKIGGLFDVADRGCWSWRLRRRLCVGSKGGCRGGWICVHRSVGGCRRAAWRVPRPRWRTPRSAWTAGLAAARLLGRPSPGSACSDTGYRTPVAQRLHACRC